MILMINAQISRMHKPLKCQSSDEEQIFRQNNLTAHVKKTIRGLTRNIKSHLFVIEAVVLCKFWWHLLGLVQ